MKKFYLYALTVLAVLITTNAKSQCPNPNGLAFPFKYTSGCYVYVVNTLPGADISVYDGLTKINTASAQTAGDGTGTAFYDCSRAVTRILLSLPNGTVCEITGSNIAALSVLPVKLSAFKVQVKGNGTAALEWASAFELESAKYMVQRSSDGTRFTTIGEVPAAGNSMSTLRYSFDDAQLGEGSAYYRLVMVDIDGKSSLSKTIYVSNRKGGSGSLSIFPNPFRSDLQLTGISTADVNRRNIRLYTATGKEVNFTISGANAIAVDAGAPRGVYVLRVGAKTYKLVKE